MNEDASAHASNPPNKTLVDKVLEAIGILLASAVILGAPWVLVAISQPWKLPEPEWLPIPDDIPLMTAEEKALAREDGVGAFTYRGMHYVDHDLPATYWLE